MNKLMELIWRLQGKNPKEEMAKLREEMRRERIAMYGPPKTAIFPTSGRE